MLSQNGTTGVWTITTDNGDHVETTYDIMGRVSTTTDQRGVEHTYLYNDAGRVAHDCVTDLGSSGIVDDAILRISTTYDDMGRVQSVASHDDPDPGEGSVVNEVEYAYDGWGNLSQEWQSHDGAVDTQTSPSVQYSYDDGASGAVAKYVRLEKVTYPDGAHDIGYDYAAGVDDVMSRLSSIFDDADHDGELDGGETIYSSYKYLGASQIVVEDYEDVEVKLDYTDNDFAGLDRFGRIAEQIWSDYGETEVIDHYSYTYDRMGNRTSKDNELHAAFDEDYTYDDLDRLLTSERADDYDQSWTLDGQGNFSEFDDDGTSQTRATNEANEIESITGGWITPEYDAAGNMIYGPQSGDETTGLHFVRDAWNRQVAVYEDDGDGVFEPSTDDTLIAEYEFDAINRRIEKILSSTHAHYYYNQNWQMLEERFVDGQGATLSSNQHVFSARYIDSPIVWLHDGNGDGDLEDVGDLVRYYLSDANHNTTAVFDSSTGEVVKRYVYSAYGMHTVYDSAWANPTAPTSDGIMYCGYWRDAETGNYQVRAREYITSLSTFDVRDPIGYAAGDANLYRYVFNNPLLHTDPSGQDCRGECYEECAKQYPRWWQYHLWVGCANGCNSGCASQTNTWTPVKVCIREFTGLPCVTAIVHCFLSVSGRTYSYDSDGIHADPGTSSVTTKCVTLTCASAAEIKGIISADQSSGKWKPGTWKFLTRNCCDWVDTVIRRAGCNGVESYFPGYNRSLFSP